jgi:hypothetical protein
MNRLLGFSILLVSACGIARPGRPDTPAAPLINPGSANDPHSTCAIAGPNLPDMTPEQLAGTYLSDDPLRTQSHALMALSVRADALAARDQMSGAMLIARHDHSREMLGIGRSRNKDAHHAGHEVSPWISEQDVHSRCGPSIGSRGQALARQYDQTVLERLSQ